MKLLLAFNPRAAAGRAGRLLPAVLRELEAFATVELLQTAAPGEVTRRLAAFELDGFDGVVAAGGDGTLFEVLNGLYGHPTAQRIPLGLLPLGTGNAFARDLGLLPGEWQSGVDIIRRGRTRPVDVGRVQTGEDSYHFLNIVGAGLPVSAMLTAAKLKFLGNSAYSLATFWHAMKLQCYPLRIELDGAVIEEDSLFVEVSNTRYTGTSFLIAPGASLDDGLLDLTLVSRLTRPRLLQLFPTVYRGEHIGHPEVTTRQARSIRISRPTGMTLAPDGELLGQTPALIECLHRDLEIFSP